MSKNLTSAIPVSLKSLSVSHNSIISTTSSSQERIQYHKAVLESVGITSISSLGTLNLSGNLIPQAGVTRPDSNLITTQAYFQSAYKVTNTVSAPVLQPFGGQGSILKSVPFPSKTVSFASIPSIASQINIDTAYWVATEINLQDNTTVVLKQPQQYLILIAEKITVGKNVTFTWERPSKSIPSKPWKPGTPPQAPTSTTLVGISGTNGTHGIKGNKAPDGNNAPELEVWVLDMIGRPAFDLRGQDGITGGAGQDGGNGGQGGKGKPAQLDWSGFCKAGAGAGGNGGVGGNAGQGGDGGHGGHGGKLSIYAPQAVINEYLKGFYITVDGGRGGSGGQPGYPGIGGAGGPVGDSVKANFGAVCGPGSRTAGLKGPDGSYAGQGSSGYSGGKFAEAVGMYVIDPDDIRIKLLEPAIFEAVPAYAFVDDSITLKGKRFTKSDTVLIDGSPVQTNAFSDTALQFIVPSLKGGQHTIQVKQSDGTLSNKASIYIKPKIDSAQQDNQITARVSPGKKVSLIGSGFSESALVRINDQDMPDVTLLSPTQLEFTLVRPTSIEENPSGEPVKVSVLLSDGTPSNTINLVLDTFHTLVIGDSVSWGQGLAEHEKHYSLVGNAIKARNGNIGYYTQVLAHSGAIIGVNDNSSLPTTDGEVPNSYPTIIKQCDLFVGEPSKVDLIIMDGGINDVNLRTVLNPFTDIELTELHRKHFLDGSKTLLEKVATTFSNAKVIVTGYYPPVSEHSDLSAVEILLVALGIAVQGIPGGIGAGFLTKQHLQIIHARSMQLANESKVFLQQAVDETNANLTGEKRFFFADPNIDGEHSALTDDPYVFGINLDMSPQDFIAAERLVSCTKSGCTGVDFEICKRASIGHPNKKGAIAYAEAIYPFL
ncbi:SGNH/GDSL hydrolase family protein [Bacillus sp. S35]|uniref:SGNH/GDSL hydrolase family protein n=1 Tax=Priestia aryabhattai TaxID=412384 RepID=UPI00190B766D|nr:SGNH/GDSL hydrolase family protein [Priestia aryabhattai]MBK0009741.1 SGNH/GDSL hydrolase family protein [Bacillus sp. S35]MCM3644449.1 SGNH/GDSL hydrolase family protein [Priestia aryabhattai]